MREVFIKPATPHEDVNGVLELLAKGLSELLNDQLVGFYLTGSLTYGDFDRGSSDIDFLAVLEQPLSPDQFESVQALHTRIGDQFPVWANRTEGSYGTRSMFKKFELPKYPRPYFNNGRLKEELPENSWFVDLYHLYQSGVVLLGPDPKALLRRVPIQLVRQASRDELHKYWEPWLHKNPPFEEPGHDIEHLQAFAVLTMCRILHRAKNDEVASKRRASTWTKQTYSQWRPLIEKAENWQHGGQMNSVQETLDFIRFTLKKVG